jgi:thioredoxin 1
MPYTASFTPEALTRAEVDARPGPLVLEFGTHWCGWCQGAQPLIQAAFSLAGAEVAHVKVEDGPGRALGRSFGVKLWPTLVFLRDGQEMARLVRPQDQAALVQALRGLQGAAATAADAPTPPSA